MDKVLSSSIRIASRLLQDGNITPPELANACLQRAKNSSKYNAFIRLTEHEAQNKAAESLERYKNNKPKSELDGITIAIKDNFCTANIKTTCAAKMLEQFVPSYNAAVYERLSNAGAVLIGKCNLDQFAMGSGTVDSIYGPTKNMWRFSDEDFFITGGSSGGCAVAVATSSCFAAIGSDTGGSTRNPASYCGLVGLKPTYGLVSRLGLIPLVNSMDVPGLLTRTVDDCVSVLNVIAGHDPKDSTSLTKPCKKIIFHPGAGNLVFSYVCRKAWLPILIRETGNRYFCQLGQRRCSNDGDHITFNNTQIWYIHLPIINKLNTK